MNANQLQTALDNGCLLTTEQAAEKAGLTVAMIRRHIESGRLEAVNLKGWVIDASSLNQLIADRTSGKISPGQPKKESSTMRKYYAGQNSYYGTSFTYDSDGWSVRTFDSKGERDAWVKDDPYPEDKQTREAITAKNAKRIDPNC